MPTVCCSWDRRINNARRRFRVLSDFNDHAVLDRETGLVWERQPTNETFAWPNARLRCAQKAVGARGGWRLPAFNELASLVDPTVTDPAVPRLPAGHPFLNVEGMYWTATFFPEEQPVQAPTEETSKPPPKFALAVGFSFVVDSDAPIFVMDVNIAGGRYHVWAVRGSSPGPHSY
jgi:hypothetical protein